MKSCFRSYPVLSFRKVLSRSRMVPSANTASGEGPPSFTSIWSFYLTSRHSFWTRYYMGESSYQSPPFDNGPLLQPRH